MPNQCRALNSLKSMSLNAVAYIAFTSNLSCSPSYRSFGGTTCEMCTASTLTGLRVVYYSSCFSHILIIKTFTWFPGENMIKFYSEMLSKCDSAKWKGFQPRIKPPLSMAGGKREWRGEREQIYYYSWSHMLSRRRCYERHRTSFALIRRTVPPQRIKILDFNTCTVEVISRRPKERSVSQVEAAVRTLVFPVDNINDTDRLSTLQGNLSKTI